MAEGTQLKVPMPSDFENKQYKIPVQKYLIESRSDKARTTSRVNFEKLDRGHSEAHILSLRIISPV
jgi:hypothetical protein